MLAAALLLSMIGVGCVAAGGIADEPASSPSSEPVAADELRRVGTVAASPILPVAEPVGPGAALSARPSKLQAVPAAPVGPFAVPAVGAPSAPVEVPRPAGRSGAAVTTGGVATVEELLEEGLHRVGASPVHLAIRGTPAASSARCAWRGIARTVQQREDAIRFWLGLAATEAIPDQTFLEALFAVVLDAFDPDFRETAKANFLAIARGGESMDYLFLTCFRRLRGQPTSCWVRGTTPTTVTVAYDPMGRCGGVRPVRAGARHGHVRN